MKKFLVLALILVSILTPLNSKAQESNSYVLNEYDKICELKSMTDKELYMYGLDTKDIEEIREIDYITEIKKRSKYSPEILKNMGYTEAQINSLKTFDGSKNQAKMLSPKITMRTSLSPAKVSSKIKKVRRFDDEDTGTKIFLKYSWEWNIMPIFTGHDLVAICWGNGFLVNPDGGSGTTACLKKINVLTGGDAVSGADINVDIDGVTKGAYINFDVYDNAEFVKSGYFQVNLMKDTIDTSRFNAKGAYGHSTILLNPTVSFSSGSISFSATMTKASEASMLVD